MYRDLKGSRVHALEIYCSVYVKVDGRLPEEGALHGSVVGVSLVAFLIGKF